MADARSGEEIKTDKGTSPLSPLWHRLLARRLMDHHALLSPDLPHTLNDLSDQLDGLKWTLLERYWELVSGECLEWARAEVGRGGELGSAVAALFLPLRLLRDLLHSSHPDALPPTPLPPLPLQEELETLGEAAWAARRAVLIQTSLHAVQDQYKTQTLRMGSPAVALELLNKVQVELMRIGRWSDGLEMPTTKLLLPITGLLLSRLEDLVAQKGFSDAKFLWTIPPQVEVVVGQVGAAIRADLGARPPPAPAPLPVDWDNVQRLLAANVRNPLRDLTHVGDRAPADPSPAHPLHSLLAHPHVPEEYQDEYSAALQFLHRYANAKGTTKEERRKEVAALRVKTDNLRPPHPTKGTHAQPDKGIYSGSPSEDSGFESFAHSPNSTFSFD